MSDSQALSEGDEIVDVHGLVAAAENMTPYFYAIAGVPWDGDGLPPIRVTDKVSEPHSLDLAVSYRAQRGRFEHRFIASVGYEGYQLVVDVAVRVDIPENIRPTHGALDEYGARVSMFTAYPYIREAFFSLVSRFELEPFTLPILRQDGTVELESEGADELVELDDVEYED